eukprot:CAMPEP_0204503958 /NCGR_PEP_ID=MMETSP0471-20130131/104529_1 /ASSEMBLY_ACC=CAM_ASM_000602 /TAXON_ID=2969 /ORGANISM="Oxyrrhis marina" /LENGTH=70 /DNA_ID=CAMNT_0051508807 /DNA_START=35 /DNA_END=247 /DNA_ORIENTATION=-
MAPKHVRFSPTVETFEVPAHDESRRMEVEYSILGDTVSFVFQFTYNWLAWTMEQPKAEPQPTVLEAAQVA